jgi:hypothetical protein
VFKRQKLDEYYTGRTRSQGEIGCQARNGVPGCKTLRKGSQPAYFMPDGQTRNHLSAKRDDERRGLSAPVVLTLPKNSESNDKRIVALEFRLSEVPALLNFGQLPLQKSSLRLGAWTLQRLAKAFGRAWVVPDI